MAKNQRSVLVVEDEALVAMTEKMQLEKYGYAVTTVATGEKAVEAVRFSTDIDLILMDIDLGSGIDGTQAAARILEDRDIPIVFLSSHTAPEVVAKTEKITSYGYVVKNSNITVLDASIKMAFKLFEAKQVLSAKEEVLVYQREFMSYVIQHSRSAIAVHDRDLKYLYVSQQYLDSYHVKERDVIGRHHYDVFPDLPEKWRLVHQKALRGEVLSAENDPFEREDGTTELTRWECRPWYERDGVIGGIIIYTEVITEQKRTEAALAETVKLLSRAQEMAHIGYWQLDLKANRLIWSDEVFRIFGFEPQQFTVTYESFLNLVHPDDRAAVDSAYTRSIEDGRSWYEIEHRIVLQDSGEVRNVHERCEHERDASGAVIRSMGMIQDISERKQAEGRYQDLFNYSNDAIFVHEMGDDDLPSRNIDVNEQASRLLGYSRDELLSLSAKEVVPVEHAPSMFHHAQELAEKGHLTFETENIRSDGRVIPVEVSAYLHQEGLRRFVVSSVRDISNRKHFEQELFNKNEYLEAILRTTPDGFWVVAPDRAIASVNDAYCRMSGYDAEDLMGMRINDIDATETPEESTLRIERVMENGSETFETKHRRKDGTLFDVEVSSSRLDRPDGVFFVSFCRDITDRKQSENAIRKLLHEKEMLVEEVQHRIKNNINTMTSLLSLQAQVADEPTAVAELENARGRLASLGALYEYLYRTEGDAHGSLHGYVMQLVLHETRVFPHGEQVEISSEIEECIVPVKTLSTLGLIVNELITNAMKHAFRDHPNPRLVITGNRHDEGYELVVEDNGPGFEAFNTGRATSGLGSTIVNSLIDQLGGSIHIESDNGAHVTVVFPITDEE
jgi:PAS domain S-box-containing protein